MLTEADKIYYLNKYNSLIILQAKKYYYNFNEVLTDLDLEDYIQISKMYIYNRLDELDTNKSITTWFKSMANFGIYEYIEIRQRKKRRVDWHKNSLNAMVSSSINDKEFTYEKIMGIEEFEDDIISNVLYNQLLNFIDTLNIKEARTILELHMQGKSNREIADVIGCKSKTTVGNRLKLIKNEIRTWLNKEENECLI